jgi:colanic acid/amylovoran biosynthesis protein
MHQKTGAYLIEKSLTNYQTKAVIEQLDYMVGTRFHGVIFALTGYVPSIAIEYEHKTRGIMSDLGLAEWVIHIEDVTAPKLSKLFIDLDNSRHAYLETLNNNLPEYLLQAASMRELVKSTYEGRLNSRGHKTETVATSSKK